MPQFRGVDRDAICDSLRRAQAFLSRFSIDPGWLPVKWDPEEALPKIAAADSDLALAHAMTETRTGVFFQPFYHFFGHYALADSDPASIYLFRDLSRWGAFDVATRHHLPVELAAIIAADMARSLDPADFQDGSYVHQRLRKAFAQAASGNDALNRTRERMLVNFMVKGQVNPDNIVRKDFLALRRDEQEYALRILRQAKAYDSARTLLEGFSPFGLYCLVVDPLPAEKRNEHIAMMLEPVREDMGAVLAPYTERGEILSQRMSLMKAGGPGGYVMMATRAAAQALADRLPDWPVVDINGDRLPPVSPGSSGPSAPRPGTPSGP